MYTHIYDMIVQRHQEVRCLMATPEIAPFHLPASLFTSLYLMLTEYPVMYQQDRQILSVPSFITFHRLSIVVVIKSPPCPIGPHSTWPFSLCLEPQSASFQAYNEWLSHTGPLFFFSKPDLYFPWNIWNCSILGIISFRSVWMKPCASLLQLWWHSAAEQTAPKDGQHERVCLSIVPMVWDSWGSAGDWLIQAGLRSVVGLVSTVLTHTSATIWLFWGWLLSRCLSSSSQDQQASPGIFSWQERKCRKAGRNAQDFLRAGSEACLPHSVDQRVSHELNSESVVEKCPCPSYGRSCEVV